VDVFESLELIQGNANAFPILPGGFGEDLIPRFRLRFRHGVDPSLKEKLGCGCAGKDSAKRESPTQNLKTFLKTR